LYYFSQIDDVSLLHRLDRVVGELCKRSSVLNNIKPTSLKLFVRAFREMHASRKGVASGYLLNYDEWDRRSKIDFIKHRGEWPGKKRLNSTQINELFEEIIARRMHQLESDVKSFS
jgi:hypothetical protein